MQMPSSRMIIAISATVALGAAALAPTAVLGKGPGPGPRADGCSGDCAAEQVADQQQVRMRDGTGGAQVRAGGQATAPVKTRAKARGGQQTQIRGGDSAGLNGNGRGIGAAGKGAAGQEGRMSGPGRGWDDGTPGGPGTCADCDVAMGTLDEADIEGLTYMANEEKLAHDVYVSFSELYDLPVFERIAASEARHQLAVDTILERYGIEDATSGLPEGEFSDPAMQQLYAELTEEGSAGLDEALAVAVRIEETDIADLEERMDGLDETAPDVHTMYENLSRASQNHLAAFQRQA